MIDITGQAEVIKNLSVEWNNILDAESDLGERKIITRGMENRMRTYRERAGAIEQIGAIALGIDISTVINLLGGEPVNGVKV